MKTFGLIAVTWMGLALGVMGQSGEPPAALRIAAVDMKRLFNEHPDTKAAEERVTKARDEARKAFRGQSEALKGVLQQHQDLIAAGNAAGGREKLEEARELEIELAKMKTTQNRDLEQSFLAEKRTILAAVQAAVKAFNETAGYHVVLDTSVASASGIPLVVDLRGVPDITEPVLALLRSKS